MSELFRTLETIEIPNGDKYEVHPLNTDELEELFNIDEEMNTVKGIEDKTESTRALLKGPFQTAKIVIQSHILKVDDKEPLPDELIQFYNFEALLNKIIAATMPDNAKVGETPLGQKKK